MVPSLSPKVAIFYYLDQVGPKKVGFFLIFSQFYKLGFLTKCWLFKQEIHLCPCFWYFWLLYFHNFVQILFERSLTKNAP